MAAAAVSSCCVAEEKIMEEDGSSFWSRMQLLSGMDKRGEREPSEELPSVDLEDRASPLPPRPKPFIMSKAPLDLEDNLLPSGVWEKEALGVEVEWT